MSATLDRPRLTVPVGERDHVARAGDGAGDARRVRRLRVPVLRRARIRSSSSARQRLGDELRFVFRNFPLDADPPARAARGRGGRGGGAQGKFWEMHDLLFEHQDALGDERPARLREPRSASTSIAFAQRARRAHPCAARARGLHERRPQRRQRHADVLRQRRPPRRRLRPRVAARGDSSASDVSFGSG